jgi:3-oxoacyl-[acyl-carrier protein] reductase
VGHSEVQMVVITGICRGIGKATKELFEKKGFDVGGFCRCVGVDVRDREAIKKWFQDRFTIPKQEFCDCTDLKRLIFNGVCCDCGNPIQPEFKPIDLLVVNSGVLKYNYIEDMSYEEWDEVIDINLTGSFNTIKEALNYLHKGSMIVIISSISAVYGVMGMMAYTASKAGLIGLYETLEKELKKKGIEVRCLFPAFVNTDMSKIVLQRIPEEVAKKLTPLVDRPKEPEEIAEEIYSLYEEIK